MLVYMTRRVWIVLAALALLAILAYLPALAQPLLEDDYPLIALSIHFGDVSGWSAILTDPVFRTRATSLMFMYGVNVGFDMTPVPYYAGMILLHVLNTWLIFALGGWNVIGYRVAAL